MIQTPNHRQTPSRRGSPLALRSLYNCAGIYAVAIFCVLSVVVVRGPLIHLDEISICVYQDQRRHMPSMAQERWCSRGLCGRGGEGDIQRCINAVPLKRKRVSIVLSCRSDIMFCAHWPARKSSARRLPHAYILSEFCGFKRQLLI